MAAQNRRQFLWMALGAGGLTALGMQRFLGRTLPGPAKVEGLVAAKRTSHALGAEVSMVVLHSSAARAQAALDAAFGELETVEELMSIYRPHSQLCRLNRDGVLKNPHPYFVEVLRCGQELSARSNGAFDVTVQPLWEVYASAQRAGRLPADAELDVARAKVDWRKLEAGSQQLRLAEKGMAVTLNGIAQGFAADRVLAVLREQGVKHALVNTGEIGALGRKEDGARWKVGIQHPRAEDAFAALAELEGKCLSTSGDYATPFSPDKSRNHIFDPKTGHSPQHFASVTVVAERGMVADALTKVVFVGGAEAGVNTAMQTPGTDIFMVRKDGSTLKTAGFPLTV